MYTIKCKCKECNRSFGFRIPIQCTATGCRGYVMKVRDKLYVCHKCSKEVEIPRFCNVCSRKDILIKCEGCNRSFDFKIPDQCTCGGDIIKVGNKQYVCRKCRKNVKIPRFCDNHLGKLPKEITFHEIPQYLNNKDFLTFRLINKNYKAEFDKVSVSGSIYHPWKFKFLNEVKFPCNVGMPYLRYLPDSNLLAFTITSKEPTRLLTLDLKKEYILHHKQIEGVKCIVELPDKRIAIANFKNQILIWDIAKGKLQQVLHFSSGIKTLGVKARFLIVLFDDMVRELRPIEDNEIGDAIEKINVQDYRFEPLFSRDKKYIGKVPLEFYPSSYELIGLDQCEKFESLLSNESFGKIFPNGDIAYLYDGAGGMRDMHPSIEIFHKTKKTRVESIYKKDFLSDISQIFDVVVLSNESLALLVKRDASPHLMIFNYKKNLTEYTRLNSWMKTLCYAPPNKLFVCDDKGTIQCFHRKSFYDHITALKTSAGRRHRKV